MYGASSPRSLAFLDQPAVRWVELNWPSGDPARGNKRQMAQDSGAGLVGRAPGT